MVRYEFQSLSNRIPIPYQSLSNLSGLEWDRKWIGFGLDFDKSSVV
ncbi:MAG TPA: hypothetical protein PLE74_05375 [Candidatus Cloacimonadota bacterium]|nr:hypothetical protein [Candidatus Cloacimonadota bacterium]